jgi:tetratricopeptide (TPR) repeat protein
MTQTLPRHNLPARDYERFVGREEELGALRRLLQPYPKSRYHLMTVDGIGGIGKSALVLEAAYRLVDAYAELAPGERFDAIVWVSAKRTYLTSEGIEERAQHLRGLDDLFAAVAQVLDYPAITRARAAQQRAIVEQALAEQRTLLLLDNMETVDDEALLEFLRELPDPTKAIVTTRHRIDVAFPIRLSGMPQADAMVLIEQTATAKNVALTAEDREALWTRSGGVPLALVWSIGLIASGVAPDEMLRRLGQGQSDIARFCFAESVAHIHGRDAHRLLLALALFAADASREALGVVAGLADDPFGRDVGLDELLELSLVNKDGDRFSLLPLTRLYVQEQEHDQGWVSEAKSRLFAYFAQFVKRHGAWSRDWRGHDLVEREWVDIVGTLDLLAENVHYVHDVLGDVTIVPHLWPEARLLVDFTIDATQTSRLRGYIEDSERLCDRAIAVSKALYASSNDLADLERFGWSCYQQSKQSFVVGDVLLLEHWGQRAVDAARAASVAQMEVLGLRQLANAAQMQGQVELAATRIQAAMDRATQAGLMGLHRHLYGMFGRVAEDRGEPQAAEAWFQRAVDSARERDDLSNAAAQLINLGRVRMTMNQHDSAYATFLDALVCGEESGRSDSIAHANIWLADLEARAGKLEQARSRAAVAYDQCRRIGMRAEQAQAAALLARLSTHDTEHTSCGKTQQ